jgi:hypothetical protein
MLFETGSHYIAQTDLELLIILPLLPEFWDYRCAPLLPGLKFLLCIWHVCVYKRVLGRKMLIPVLTHH